MRDQFVANVSDVVKFALLRALTDRDRTLGVAWYYVPGEVGQVDDNDMEWRHEPAWRRLDPVLYVGLAGLPERSVAALERAAIWPPGTLFHGEPVPPRPQRNAWSDHQRTALSGADIVFLDPDAGVGKADRKHATIDELHRLRTPGRTLVFISFPGYRDHEVLVKKLHENLRSEAGATSVVTLRSSVCVPRDSDPRFCVPRLRWLTLVDPDETLVARTGFFADALASVPRVSVKLDGPG